MRITGSTAAAAAADTAVRPEIAAGQTQAARGSKENTGSLTTLLEDTYTPSKEAERYLVKGNGKLGSLEHASALDRNEMFLKGMLQKIFGVKIGKLDIQELSLSRSSGGLDAWTAQAGTGTDASSSVMHYESQSMDFALDGVIKTKDGQEVAFSLQLSMSHQVLSQRNVSAGDPSSGDPLTLSFDGLAAELTNMQFSFALDSDDGSSDQAGVGALFTRPPQQIDLVA